MINYGICEVNLLEIGVVWLCADVDKNLAPCSEHLSSLAGSRLTFSSLCVSASSASQRMRFHVNLQVGLDCVAWRIGHVAEEWMEALLTSGLLRIDQIIYPLHLALIRWSVRGGLESLPPAWNQDGPCSLSLSRDLTELGGKVR